MTIEQNDLNRMGGQSFTTILKKENMKSRFMVCEIWPLNSTTMTSSLVQTKFSL
jgi:hypothetical protein